MSVSSSSVSGSIATRAVLTGLLCLVVCVACDEGLGQKADHQAPSSVRTPLPAGPPGHVSTLEGLKSVSQFIAFHPDGRHVVSSARGETREWDLENGESTRIVRAAGISALSPDGQKIVIVWRRRIQLFDTTSGEQLRELSPQPGKATRILEWSPDGKWIAGGGDGKVVRVWDAATGQIRHELKGHTRSVRALAFSPDSSSLISGGHDGMIRSWDLESGQEQRAPIKAGFGLWSLQFSPDGRFALSAGRHQDVVLWDLESGAEARRLQGHIAFVHRAVFLPDGRRVVTGSDDRTVRCWDIQTGSEMVRFEGHECHILDVAVSPDGRFAASAGGGVTVDRRWSPGEDFDVRVWRLPKLHVDSGSDGSPSDGKTLTLTQLEDGSPGVHSETRHPKYQVTALDMTRDGRLMATGEKNGLVRISEVASKRTIARFQIDEERVSTVAFSPDGSRLIAGTHGQKLRLWDAKTRKLLLERDNLRRQVRCAGFFPDGRRILVGVRGGIRIWDTEADEITRLEAPGFHSNDVAVSSDGSTVAAACHDMLVRVWDVTTGELLHELKGHTDQVTSCDFDPSGLRLVSGARDNSIRLWDIEAGDAIRTFDGHTDIVFSVSFLSDGLRIMSGANWKDGTVRLWEADTGKELWKYSMNSSQILTLASTADARFAAARTDEATVVLRLPRLENMSAMEAYELARKNKGPTLSVAVLDFADKGPSAELAPLRHALAEMLTARLGQYDRVDSVERRIVEQFLRETTLGKTGAIDQETAQQAAKTLTADYLVSGTFSGEDGKITVDAKLSKTGDEKPVAELTASAAADQLFSIEQELAERILEQLGMKRPELDVFPPRKTTSTATVAVVPFRNLGDVPLSATAAEEGLSFDDSNALRQGIAELLQSTLSVFPDVKLVERDQLEKVLAEQELSMSGLVDPKTAARIGKIAGADRFIYGSYLSSGDRLTVIARLADTESAQIIGTEIADGTSKDLLPLFEKLGDRLARRMNVKRPGDAARLLRQAIPVRKLEAATYAAKANAFLRQGDYEAAFENFDRVLLVEPNNGGIRGRYLKALFRHGRHEKVIELAESTLTRKRLARNRELKDTVYRYYLNSLQFTGQNEKRIQVARQWSKESPAGTYAEKEARQEEAFALRNAGRRAEAVALLEAAAMKAEVSGNEVSYGNELTWLYNFYYQERASYRSTVKSTQDSALRAVEIAETLLELADGRKGRSFSIWAANLVPYAVNIGYWDSESGQYKRVMTTEEQTDFLNRARAVYSWDAEVVSDADFALATIYSDSEQWPEALKAFQDFRANPHFVADDVVSNYDREYIRPRDWIDRHVEAQFRIGQILHEHLDRPDEAIKAYQRYVGLFGLVNPHGPHVLKRLKELGVEPRFPARSVLVWGGATETLKSWQKVLRPHGYRVHLVRRYYLTAADLAPYDVVILARSGDIPFEPIDILGLRSYVATGGSLAITVTPAWEAAAPLIHRGLLSLFGVRPGTEVIDPARATKIDAEHPITRKLPALTARHAVGLECPFGTSLVEANGKTILAARPYRNGRVVVSSFGQWLMPDPSIFGSTWQRDVASRSDTSRSVKSMPLQSYSGTHKKLIEQTFAWLTGDRSGAQQSAESSEPGIEAQRQVFNAAWKAAREYEARAASRDRMTEALEQAIDYSSGQWKEEALWLAGEAHLRMQFFDQPAHLYWPPYGYHRDSGMPLPVPEYYERLVRDFPDSPLQSFAQWRLAECTYRPATNEGTEHLATLNSETRNRLIDQYENPDFSNGTLPWALAQSRLGRIRFQEGALAEAAGHFHAVSETMPPSVERICALLDLALCYKKLGQTAKALDAVNAVKTLPNVELVSSSDGQYGTLISDFVESQEVAERLARQLQTRN